MNADHLPLNTENGDGAVRTEELAEKSLQELSARVAEVARRLQDSLSGLYPPLSNLAQAHCRDVQPYLRAAIVLSAGDAQARDEQTQERLILVAAALEMLSVALSIHRLLLLPNTDTSLDKALVGSTILTGDYCFSRAAVLAAQTESPVVVDIFSQALKQVSEENLRILFADEINPHGEDEILAEAGVRAAFHLLHEKTNLIQLQTELAILVARRKNSEFIRRLQEQEIMQQLGPVVTERWTALLQWFTVNAKPSSVAR